VVALVNALLVCTLCGVGWRTFTKHRKARQWFTMLASPAKQVRVPFYTRVYVIRCWQEHTTPDHERVIRYALDIPATGQRRGFTSTAALLDTLATELPSVSETPPHKGPARLA